MLSLNRRIHRAYQRTRDANFSLEGLIGFNMHQRTAGIIGTGKIGIATMRILKGFGMKLLAFDPYPNWSWVRSTLICTRCMRSLMSSLCTAR